jgi:hypothetical protein
MEHFISEIKRLVPFKDDTEEGDVVLILAEEEEQPTVLYAVVTSIERDSSRRDEWWHVSMQLLAVPLQPVVWTLRTPQFTGQESFTMGGKARFVKAVRFGLPQPTTSPEPKARGGLWLVK